MTGLVSSLLTLARSDSGNLPVDRSDVDLAELVGMTVEQYTPIARSEDIVLMNAAMPARAQVDGDLIVQLLVNLIDNAIADTPCGGTIEVGSRIEGARVQLWVEDSGPGIQPADRERIFDRFYRVDTGRDRASGGRAGPLDLPGHRRGAWGNDLSRRISSRAAPI